MSIPAEPSLFQYEVQVFNYEPCKQLNGPGGGSVLWFNIADLSDHCSVILLQTLEAGLCYWPSFGFSSLNFFQAVFTRVVVESSQPPAAESMSPR